MPARRRRPEPAARSGTLPPDQVPFQNFLHQVRVDGLGEMSIESGHSGPFLVLRLPPTGQGDQVGALSPVLVPDRTGNFVAVEIRHSDIEDDDIGTVLPAQFQRLMTRMGDDDFMAAKLQQHAHGFGRIAVVVGYEDPGMHDFVPAVRMMT
jgi:hypothetical protein